jgi:MscS family membrane protein
MTDIITILKKEAWMLTSVLILFMVFCISFFETWVYKKFHLKLLKTESLWDDILLDSIHLPLQIGIWVVGSLLIFKEFLHNFHLKANLLRIEGILELCVILIIAWFFLRFVSRIEMRMLYRHRRMKKGSEAMTINAICHMSRIIILIILALSILQLFGIPLAAVVTISSVGMVAIAYSAKEQLSNVFAGMILFWDRPFVVGDWIRSPDKSIEGTVEYIGWRLTAVRTFDRRLRYIPNGLFSSIIVENAARMSHRRIKATIGIRYEDSSRIGPLVKALNETLIAMDGIDKEQTNFVRFFHFGASSLDLIVNLYTVRTEWLEYVAFREEVFLHILKTVADFKAECAFPTRTLHMADK